MKYLFLILFLFSCSHLQDDIAPGYAEGNYFSMEFDYNSKHYSGTLPIIMGKEVPEKTITVNLFYTGTIHLFSRACGINKSIRWSGNLELNVKELISFPRECSIEMTAMADSIHNLQHNIWEKGRIETFVMSNSEVPIDMDYALQLQEGPILKSQQIVLDTRSDSGILAMTSTCNTSFQKEYIGRYSSVSLRDLFNSEQVSLKEIQGCDFYFRAIPYEEPETRVGKLSINIYSASIIPLDEPQPEIRGNKLLLRFPEYIIASSINGKIFTKDAKVKYDSNKLYNIKWITKSGRKSSIMFLNGIKLWTMRF